MNFATFQKYQKRLVPLVPFVPSAETPDNTRSSAGQVVGQIEKTDLSHLSPNAQRDKRDKDRTSQNNVLIPQVTTVKSRSFRDFAGRGQMGQAGQAKNDDLKKDQKLFETLPDELAVLITTVSKKADADEEEIDDMKLHILEFINTEPNGFAKAQASFTALLTQLPLLIHPTTHKTVEINDHAK